ncbi:MULTISPECIES: glycerol-3-phosphate 1-O-acyltransferase PlsY [Psychrilyobacter]|uniref:Glycerol-3-phosphate acyltransferase n=1 Tax=Psychrilyobacter piezotolerans TaxID=2293438 RepID=A0ABX9KK33_9FUSO|nr:MULTISPECIES: glycerol-3-phosphate 1-O-acyltransferase PlsY [Psychrilyobacter]MCS5421421.1 glycerol-3-phosphate 1-O-acyltransferase PlsY [Psychrilyobacter sp. S5]NDI76597.1 glycerol-3-phosphate 1-O-acyltransferase PlsY [Psychrilyobacter piezotolerans]RDE65228.1 glycerol-3-phosphate 1-O-acyltransferase [Psychrilyobacter sp. S5]REI42846.1 glycerol-3-phosphate 1-O-acyltransferase [Psychrilyobacter piezotolerans]
MEVKLIIFLIIAYFMGSIPTGVVIGKKFKGIDIREHGSKNTGATNAYRVLGKQYGIIVLLADALKGYLPVFLAHLAGINGWQLILVGLVTIVGHTLSMFLKFKGGKGVATSLGVFLYLVPNIVLILVAVFILIAFSTKYVSLASVSAAGLFPILVLFMPVKPELGKWNMFGFALIIALFVIFKHRSNIQRLLHGNENKFGAKK